MIFYNKFIVFIRGDHQKDVKIFCRGKATVV